MTRKVIVNYWDKYNSLTIIKEIEWKKRKSWYKVRRVRCICECWKEHDVCLSHLRNWGVKSCWCIRWWKVIHWQNMRWKTTKEYKTYMWMRRRCYNKNDKRYSQYWWRGITIERNSFEDFYRDMWDAPSKEHSIDRIDCNWNYCKENCRWATNIEQARNKRTSRIFTYKWIAWTTWHICEQLWIETNPKTVIQRIRKYWWSVDKAFST